MIARIRKDLDNKEKGFTLIELLVVIIIIGILAAIAIPLFLNQRKKAEDSAAKADVSTIGKEIATYFVDNTDDEVSVTTKPVDETDHYFLSGGDLDSEVDLGKASDNVEITQQDINGPTDWCVAVQNEEGDKAENPGFEYSSTGGLDEGQCGGSSGETGNSTT